MEKPGKRDDPNHDPTAFCRGHGGVEVIVYTFHAAVGLAFRWPKGAPVTVVTIGAHFGDKIEWRGPASGAFTPQAAIARVIFEDAETRRKHQALAVIRLQAGKACIMSAVDMTANRSPYEIAQRIADEKAASFVCGKSEVSAGGEPTQWTTHLLE